ncbi:NlpC/P60 family protein [Herbivorax sp. ANBcel31]|uniref:NlpC/P60 family protein n=1 Tax=Herbivorax sp. ANBcel31 TaxID=3069754 RepID=UPI0027B6C00D|nr:NlpC/P60 family protein [Herbivorax sp. ANBcel31]MDQ2086787.1 NlpC/P60 family protein [Herbivorax sp. ANBcel31]
MLAFEKGKLQKVKVFVAAFMILALIALLIGLIMYPINRTIVNIIILADLIAILVLCTVVFWQFKVYKGFLIFLALATVFMLFFDGKSVERDIVRNEYVEALKRYEGTEYLWGGESIRGIDCSGLVRRGLIDAYVKLGAKNFSPQYIRKAVYLWVNDFSTRVMEDGYEDLFVSIISVEGLNQFDHSMIREGDIMVTENGLHTMAYIGNDKWIQADPMHEKVIIEKAPSDSNNWYEEPAIILSWSNLAMP